MKMKKGILTIAVAVLVLVPGLAHAASYVLAPASASVVSGQSFAVQVNVAASDQAVNALSGELSFPADVLQVMSVSRTGSIVNIWVREPTYSNVNGTIRFEGAILNPGYQGNAGHVLTITFRAIGGGSAALAFRSAAILANDGKGTNVITGLASARYTINEAPVTKPVPSAPVTPLTAAATQSGANITSITHPSTDTWSRSADAQFAWELPASATGVQYGLDRSANGQPGAATAGRIDKVTVPLNDFPEDGAYYFHLRYRTGDAAGTLQTRRILVDRVPPERLEVSEFASGDPTEPRRELRVEALDAASGVSHLEVTWDHGTLRVPASSMGRFTLPALGPGTHNVAVRAVDRAGNGRVAHAFVRVDPIASPTLAMEISREGQAWLLEKPTVFEPIVYGTASAGKDVIVSFTPRGGSAREMIAPVGSDGSWRLAYAPLALGSWEVRATARDERGALSLPAGPLAVTSDSPLTALLDVLPWIMVFALAGVLLYVIRRRNVIGALRAQTRID